MSATLNAAAFSKYYNDCPSLNIPGFTYPVEELYLEDIYTLNRFIQSFKICLCILTKNIIIFQLKLYLSTKCSKKRSRNVKLGDPFGEFVIPYIKYN